jgi:hypothetical protein
MISDVARVVGVREADGECQGVHVLRGAGPPRVLCSFPHEVVLVITDSFPAALPPCSGAERVVCGVQQRLHSWEGWGQNYSL